MASGIGFLNDGLEDDNGNQQFGPPNTDVMNARLEDDNGNQYFGSPNIVVVNDPVEYLTENQHLRLPNVMPFHQHRFSISKPMADETEGTHDTNSLTDVADNVSDDTCSYKEISVKVPVTTEFNKRAGGIFQRVKKTLSKEQSSGYVTEDPIPLDIFYRNDTFLARMAYDDSRRPTLIQLHDGMGATKDKDKSFIKKPFVISGGRVNKYVVTKLGWIKGVMIPTLLNIWGVILFLRLPWIVGKAGIGFSCVIVILATCITVVTALSMSAVCTNGEIKGGGAYYLISRSLGPEFGGSIGVLFSVANAVAVALYLVGFGETVQAVMSRYGIQFIDTNNDIRIIGLMALAVIFLITLVGLEWVMHTQIILLVLLVAAVVSVVAGTIYPSPEEGRDKMTAFGLSGYDIDNFKVNFYPEFEDVNGFFEAFAIFFPAATGIMAGSNLSGDLKDPSDAVPRGTLIAITISSTSYVVLCWVLGASVMRDASGVIPALISGSGETIDVNNTYMAEIITNATSNISNVDFFCTPGNCNYGSLNDLQIMEKISLWGPLVLIGIFAATLSSALASLVSAPKVFQALCKDNIFPHIDIFGREYGRNGEPRNGYILALIIAAAFTSIGELNIIAPIISNFFLIAYALVNYSVFLSSISKSPGWRPSFRYYNQWVSLLGFILCIVIMFLINWWAALITIACVAALYKFIDIRKPDINWGSFGQAHTYVKALRYTRRLEECGEHVKNFRVQCLCLSGKPSSRPNLVHFASHLTKHFGLLVCGEVLITEYLKSPAEQKNTWLRDQKIKAFHQIVQATSLKNGVRCMLQSVGLGKLRPNTLVIGFMSRWQLASPEEVQDYFQIIHDAFDLHYGVAILRVQDGFDINDEVEDGIEHITQCVDIQKDCIKDLDAKEKQTQNQECNVADEEFFHPPEILMNFDQKHKGYIDVWWLYDDGGLTILVPHILSLSSHWRGCKMRIFTPASDKKIKANQIRMANLLKKFRIHFSTVIEFRGINKRPTEESVNSFKAICNGAHLPTDGILDKKTLRQIRLAELLQEHSSEAKLIIITLTVPKQSFVTSLMYMSWLEVLSAHLPPVLMIRGNQSSVLTFYS